MSIRNFIAANRAGCRQRPAQSPRAAARRCCGCRRNDERRRADRRGRRAAPERPMEPGKGSGGAALPGALSVREGRGPHPGRFGSFCRRAIAALSPQLVTFNGSSFDLPVLRYRGMVHGVAAPGLAARPYSIGTPRMRSICATCCPRFAGDCQMPSLAQARLIWPIS